MPARHYSEREIDSLTDRGGFRTFGGRQEYLRRRMVFEARRNREQALMNAGYYLSAPGVYEGAIALGLFGVATLISRCFN
ncbi:MAG: hypothetical protein ABIH92_01150 [Nanoarchaeota archaeon]